MKRRLTWCTDWGGSWGHVVDVETKTLGGARGWCCNRRPGRALPLGRGERGGRLRGLPTSEPSKAPPSDLWEERVSCKWRAETPACLGMTLPLSITPPELSGSIYWRKKYPFETSNTWWTVFLRAITSLFKKRVLKIILNPKFYPKSQFKLDVEGK